MRTVFVMIKCQMGRTYQVAAALVEELPETREVHSISGEYDVLAKFVLEEGADIGRFVCEQVQTLDYIAATFTIVSLNPFTEDHLAADPLAERPRSRASPA